MLYDIGEAHILILNLDKSLEEYLKILLEGEGYKVSEATSEESVVKELLDRKADILMLDLESVHALDICKKVRANFALRHIPIVLLVKQEHTIEKIKGIYAGADDYIEKPIQAGEMLTRIKANLWRAKRDLDANPLTKLPGNVSILKELEKRIESGDKICVGYADLDKFKEYNDYYGFEWGDKVIRHTALVISTSLVECGTPNDFLGHIGGDDFIFITSWDCITDVCEKIMNDFDKTIPSFYQSEDLKRGGIVVKNRKGEVTSCPILTISIGVATNEHRPLDHVGKIIQIATELKTYTKTFSKSIYVIDRRRE